MSETIKPQRSHELDWRVVRDDASTHFRTGSFAAGVALIDAIGKLADAANHHPDVDLRYHGVTVRLRTHSESRLTERDVALARQISDAARELGVPVDLTGLQAVQVVIDALVIPRCCRSGAPCSATNRWTTRIWLTPTGRGRRSGSNRWTRRAHSATGSTSMSTCRTTKRRRASRRRSPRVVTWSATRTRPGGGLWPTPRATRSTSPVGRTATELDLRSYGSTPCVPGWRFD